MKHHICDWILKLSKYPEKLHSTENLVDINKIVFLYIKIVFLYMFGFMAIFHVWKRAILHKEISIVSNFSIQLISESNKKKNPALLFYQPGLAGLHVLSKFCVNILTANLYCILLWRDKYLTVSGITKPLPHLQTSICA